MDPQFTPEQIATFWSKVVIGDTNTCWEWQRGKMRLGYGGFWLNGTFFYAHRFAFYLTHGSWPTSAFHTCENPACCNPSHLSESHPETDVETRFWPNVERGEDDACWEWRGSRQVNGYGCIRINNRGFRTHRIAWELTNGPIPKGMHICHACDNPPCCNPRHLFLGTQRDNMRDAIAKGRFRFIPEESKRVGVKLTPDMVREIRRRVAAGEMQTALAREFGINKYTMRSIVHRRTWRHLSDHG